MFMESKTFSKNQELTEETFQTLLKGIHIPAQPQIMVDLQMEMAHPHCSLTKISTIITKDIGISGSVLKVVNSPFFGLRNKITSIQQALNLLGIKNVVNIVNALSLRNSLSYQSLIDMTKIWDSAMDIAMASAAIAKRIGIASPDEAYTIGLFHNCGISLLMNKHENYLSVLNAGYAEPKRLITEIENAAIGTNHAVVGYFVAKAWKLPNYLCQIIAEHHKSESLFSDQISCDKTEKNLLSVLKLAEHTCETYRTLGDAKQDFEFKRIKHDLLLYVGLSEYDFEDLVSEVRDMVLSQ